MKRLSIVVLAMSFSVLFFSVPAFAGQEKEVFGPKVYQRGSGGPTVFQASFTACDPKGSFKIIVVNGDALGNLRVSSGTVYINGIPVVTQDDFNQNTAIIERTVYGITKDNALYVKLQSAPGDYITVTVAGVMNCLEAHITSPANGSVISDYGTIIKGTIEAQDGSEIGVTVNGIPAEVSGKTFAVTGLPLQEGENTIAVKATDDTGNIAGDSVTVTLSNPIANPVYLSSYPASGEAPLAVKFTLDDTVPKAKVEYDFDWEGDGVIDAQLSDIASVTSGIAHTYQSEGIYYPTVSIKTSDGEIFSKTAIVNVSRVPDLGAKWGNMTSSLSAGDVDSAAKYFSLSTREGYQKQFQALKDMGALAQVVAGMGDMQIVKKMGNAAEGDMRVMQDGKEYSFYVFFIKDEDGIWRIKSF